MKMSKILSGLVLGVFWFLCCMEVEAKEKDTSRYSTDLEKIVVTASKIEQENRYSTQNISIVTEEDIYSSGITEVTEVLDLLPSVDIIEYGSNGSTRSVHTRGASSSQVLTLVDGRPVNTPRDGQTDFNHIPLSNIERIEVLRGPASSMYGASAVGGVINIITKSGEEERQTNVLTKLGSFSTKYASLTQGDKDKNLDYFFAYDYLASHGHRDNADYLSNNINTKFGCQLNDDNRISLSSGYYNSEVGAPGGLSFVDLDDRQETFNKYVDITYNGKLREGQDIILKLYHNFDRLEFIEAFEPINKDTHQTKVDAIDTQVSQTLFEAFRTAVGFNYQDHRLNSSISNKHTYNLKGVNFESEIDLFDKSSLKFGARWDDYSNFGDKLSPSASFNFWLFDKLKFHTLLAKSFRAPTFNDLYWNQPDFGLQGDPSLGPEKAVSYEAGVSGYFFNRVKADATFFRTNFDDLIEWTPNNDFTIWSPANINSAAIKGVEFETEFALKEYLKANLNYTYLESENKSTQKWLIYRPRHLYKMRLTYSPIPKYELSLNGIYKTKRFTNSGNTAFLERHFAMDANFAYKISDSAQFLFELKNVFDRQYQEEYDYSMPGRAVYSGVKLTF